jgi:hypothetical protein
VLAEETSAKTPEYGWTNEVVAGLNFNQTHFDNWVQGGEDAWSWQFDLISRFNNDREKFNWSNSGKMSFGKTRISGNEARKSADEIDLESVFTYKIGLPICPYAAATAKSQFARGYDYSAEPKNEISSYLDPAFFTQGIGAGYSPICELKTRLGASVKETVTRNHPAPYADDPETEEIEKIKVEFGAESAADLKWKFGKNILIVSKLNLFSNLKSYREIDVTWDNIATASIAKYLNANLNVKLFYDRDISKKRQIKEVIAVGLTYSLL